MAMNNITTNHKKPCPYYCIVRGTSKRCWIDTGTRCPENVTCIDKEADLESPIFGWVSR